MPIGMYPRPEMIRMQASRKRLLWRPSQLEFPVCQAQVSVVYRVMLVMYSLAKVTIQSQAPLHP